MSRKRTKRFPRDNDGTSIPVADDPIVELILNHCGVRKKNIPAPVALAKVDSQIDAIIEMIDKGNIRRVEQYLYDLVKFNLETGDKSYLGMTICRLTKRALEKDECSFVAKLLEYSMLIGLDDPVIYTARADIHKARGKLHEALAVYDEMIAQFPENLFARNGRADVLNKMGRHAEALFVYDETVAQFPGNIFALNGRAGVLKKMGRFSEALAAYDETIAWFPDDMVARSGRAEVLKEMGRLPEALAAYEETIELFSENLFARTGRAEVLKEMGRH